jgi:hypothetical protein
MCSSHCVLFGVGPTSVRATKVFGEASCTAHKLGVYQGCPVFGFPQNMTHPVSVPPCVVFHVPVKSPDDSYHAEPPLQLQVVHPVAVFTVKAAPGLPVGYEPVHQTISHIPKLQDEGFT